MSQAAFAEKVNISIAFLSQIERGIKYPASETLSSIANALGVEVCELFKDGEAPAGHHNLLARFKSDVLNSVEAIYAAYKK